MCELNLMGGMGKHTEIKPNDSVRAPSKWLYTLLHYYIRYYDYTYLCSFNSYHSFVASNILDYTLHYWNLSDDYGMLRQYQRNRWHNTNSFSEEAQQRMAQDCCFGETKGMGLRIRLVATRRMVIGWLMNYLRWKVFYTFGVDRRCAGLAG